MYSSLSSWLKVGLCAELTFRHLRMSRFSGDGRLHFSWSQLTGVCTLCFSSASDSQLWKGVWPCRISQSSTPNDHTSVLGPQTLCSRPSGDMQAGEPMLTSLNSRLQWVAKPKSPILALPAPSKILAALISRCTMLMDSRQSSPWKTSLMMPLAWLRSSLSPKCPFFSRRERSPPSQNSQTVQQLLAVLKYSMQETTLGCLRRRIMLISSQKRSSMPISLILRSSTIFTATGASLPSSLAWQTLEKVPSPSLAARSMRQFWMRFSYLKLELGQRLAFYSAHSLLKSWIVLLMLLGCCRFIYQVNKIKSKFY